MLSSGSQKLNKVSVVVSEVNIDNLDIGTLSFRLNSMSRSFIAFSLVVLSENLFNLFDEVSLESFSNSTSLFLVLVPFVLLEPIKSLRGNIHFYGVVASSNCRAIPLDLLNLSELSQVVDSGREEHAD